MKMVSPLDHWHSSSCCFCCHVRTGTIILGVWYMLPPGQCGIPQGSILGLFSLSLDDAICRHGLIDGVVLLILLSALVDPVRYQLLPNADPGSDFDTADVANICIATAISLLMIMICGMATYGAYKQRSAWIIPFFCYLLFDFALNTLVVISVVVYPNSIRDYLQQMPANFPYKEEIISMNTTCQVFIVLIFIGVILAFKAYLIGCVWNCYRYIKSRNSSDVLVYVTTNDTAVLLSPYEEAVVMPVKDPPPPYMSV